MAMYIHAARKRKNEHFVHGNDIPCCCDQQNKRTTIFARTRRCNKQQQNCMLLTERHSIARLFCQLASSNNTSCHMSALPISDDCTRLLSNVQYQLETSFLLDSNCGSTYRSSVVTSSSELCNTANACHDLACPACGE